MYEKVCKYCGAPFKDVFGNRKKCNDCKLNMKPRPPRRTRIDHVQAMKLAWTRFLEEHNLTWWSRKGRAIGGRGTAGSLVGLDALGGPTKPIPIGFFTRKDGAWVTVILKDGHITFESRCFKTWVNGAYGWGEWRKTLPPWWKDEEVCQCDACEAAKWLNNLSRKCGQGPASPPATENVGTSS